MVNFDSIASPLGHFQMIYAGRRDLGEFSSKEMKRRGIYVTACSKAVPFADHFVFSVFGVPALWFFRENFPGGRWQHHSVHDNLENISPRVVAEFLSATGGMIADIARMVELPFSRGLDSNLRVKTLEYARILFGFKIRKEKPA
ncbi:hypothetical protein ES703_80173 [subsurface metagenome]